jgi:hypothetical protein
MRETTIALCVVFFILGVCIRGNETECTVSFSKGKETHVLIGHR